MLFIYNQIPLNVLNGLCPFEAMFLRSPREPFEYSVKQKLKKSWIDLFGNESDDIFAQVATVHRNRFNSEKVRISDQPAVLKQRQNVLVFKHNRKGDSKKLSRQWLGPYIVIRRTNPDVYLLKHAMTKKRLKRHISLIRLLDQNNPGSEPDGIILRNLDVV